MKDTAKIADANPVSSKLAQVRGRQVNDVQYISSTEAIELLGIRRESFYTYVSRGLIKAIRKEGSKAKLYKKADVEKLRTRAGARTGGPAVSQSLRYGEPIVQTWISEVTVRGPRYRGHLALDLVRDRRSFEFVSELIWEGLPKARDLPWAVYKPALAIEPLLKASRGVTDARGSPLRYLSLAAIALSTMEVEDNQAESSDPILSAKTLLHMFAGVAGLIGPKSVFTPPRVGERISECVARGLGFEVSSQAIDAINGALVLSAEHELSAPTFAVRICASTGVDLNACIAAGLMAQAGPMQVGGTFDVERLIATAAASKNINLAEIVSVPLPCFSHPLYDRDPRAVWLIEVARSLSRKTAGSNKVWALVDAAGEAGQHPNIFAALVMLSYSLGLPPGCAALLHTLGRSSGWIAHAMEQRLTGSMLRPRAKYMGAQLPSAELKRIGTQNCSLA